MGPGNLPGTAALSRRRSRRWLRALGSRRHGPPSICSAGGYGFRPGKPGEDGEHRAQMTIIGPEPVLDPVQDPPLAARPAPAGPHPSAGARERHGRPDPHRDALFAGCPAPDTVRHGPQRIGEAAPGHRTAAADRLRIIDLLHRAAPERNREEQFGIRAPARTTHHPVRGILAQPFPARTDSAGRPADYRSYSTVAGWSKTLIPLVTDGVRYRGLGQADCCAERLVIPGWSSSTRELLPAGRRITIRCRGPEQLLQLNVTSAGAGAATQL